MKYVNVQTVLPDSLIKEIQKYINGEYIYIPSKEDTRKKWGETSGTRDYIRKRNEDIKSKHKGGQTVLNLAEEFFLSIDSIKKIVYSKK
ncbi:CD3324 family protein [Clostridium algidicarnis]|uniref:CD3324 family protein n=1 Tax=Clostridium algidicarnis TaxID=37659 RepID=UPI001C0B2D7D|nr:hypothetical protein [Clostridium algidicarnis]MBU3209491.1 hypothetical protein [Clostridium algidicarnis]MBU3212273.1 hypothetical protein [Clostridium algidicarnis]MBU3221222.1 hypothetical protein [Clostridium algidicarnis]MBU3227254.1 hypothetical protein [Clostridium algidicarnis]